MLCNPSINSLVFQTHASRIGSIQDDTLSLLRGYLANFIKPEVITASSDITAINYRDQNNQLSNDILAISTETLLFLSEFEDEIEETVIERRFFKSVRVFYETAVSKLLAKFLLKDNTLSDLSFIPIIVLRVPHEVLFAFVIVSWLTNLKKLIL